MIITSTQIWSPCRTRLSSFFFLFGLSFSLVTSGLAQAPVGASASSKAKLPRNTVIATIPAGGAPYAAVVSLDSTTLYVTNSASGTVSVIDTATNTVTTTIGVGQAPDGLAITPDGSTLYVVNFGDYSASVIDTHTNLRTDTFGTGPTPNKVAISPDGKSAYFPGEGEIVIYDTSTNRPSGSIQFSVSQEAIWIVIAPDGNPYVGCYGTERVQRGLFLVDTESDKLEGLALGKLKSPLGMTISPNGQTLYVVNARSISGQPTDVVAVYNIAQDKVTARISLGAPVEGAFGGEDSAITPDGKYLYVPAPNHNEVLMIDTEKNQIAGSPIAVENGLMGVAIAPNGKYAYAVNAISNTVSVIDIRPQ